MTALGPAPTRNEPADDEDLAFLILIRTYRDAYIQAEIHSPGEQSTNTSNWAHHELMSAIRRLRIKAEQAEAVINRVRTIRDACTMTIVMTEDGKVPGKAVADWIDRAISPTACRECGCTDDDCSGCVERTGEPCHWVEPDLCSACSAQPVPVAS